MSEPRSYFVKNQRENSIRRNSQWLKSWREHCNINDNVSDEEKFAEEKNEMSNEENETKKNASKLEV